MPHLALIHQNLFDANGEISKDISIPVRIHSECMTGDVFGSKRCECGEQLSHALNVLGADDAPGIVLYLRQEGRGIGLVEKLRAYNLQDVGMDTFAANRALGHADDLRNYDDAISILKDLGVMSIRLMTNNPDKIMAVSQSGISVERLPLEIPPNDVNKAYLKAKRNAGHFLSDL